jgi:hypothetical protein
MYPHVGWLLWKAHVAGSFVLLFHTDLIWLVVSNMFFHILGIMIPTNIFQRVETTNQL